MNHYQATTDHVIGFVPIEPDGEMIIGGIIVPPNVKKRMGDAIAQFIVHSVGPDCGIVKPGDRVFYNRHHQSEPFACEDGGLIWLTESQVIAVVTPEPEKEKPATPEQPLDVATIRSAIENGGFIPAKKPEPVADAVVEEKVT